MRHSETIADLAAAMAAAQGELRPAPLDGKNPHFGSRYATLAALWATARPVLAAHGLSILQGRGLDGGIETVILHASGEWIVLDGVAMRPVKDDPQGAASAMTYARRYGLAAAVGLVADDDDDGNAASAGNAPERPNIASTPRDSVGHAGGVNAAASTTRGVNAGHTPAPTAGIPPFGTVEAAANKTAGVLVGVLQMTPEDNPIVTRNQGTVVTKYTVLRDAHGVDWRIVAWHDAADQAAELAAGDTVEVEGLWNVYKGSTKLDASSITRLSPGPLSSEGAPLDGGVSSDDGDLDPLPF